jgi:hypothetical protein
MGITLFSARTARPLKLDVGASAVAKGLYLGIGSLALEVVVVEATVPPAPQTVRGWWKDRVAGRSVPVMLVVVHGGQTTICGPAGNPPPLHEGLDLGQVERLCIKALNQPDRHAAHLSLARSIQMAVDDMPGLHNRGFLATHELRTGLRNRPDWNTLCEKSRSILSRTGTQLYSALGFSVTSHDNQTVVLRAKEKKVALAVLLQQNETQEMANSRFSGVSPISYALTVADRENIPYVMTVQEDAIRLYPTQLNAGVGRRSRTETYVEVFTSLVRDQDAAYLWLLFSAEALLPGGHLETVLAASMRYAGSLALNLRQRIYERVMPRLATAIATARKLRKPDAAVLAETYEMATTLLFRLLFIAYAEDKDLLPYNLNGAYQKRAIKTKARELLEFQKVGGEFSDTDNTLWQEVFLLFRAVDKGRQEWGIPHYNGGLFSEDAAVSRVGHFLSGLTISDADFGPALRDLLLIESDDGQLGPVDFRSLGVREFGTIYEGLLESDLARADVALTTDSKGVYRPAKGKDTVIVGEGEYYLHNQSGARKASGSYFTKDFAVYHLLDQALEPALVEHLKRLDAIDEVTAGEQFFDFRIADIAMGSGHFLVFAIDRIERAFTNYLSQRKLPVVSKELARLRESASAELGEMAAQVEIEDAQLIRRLIAKRCVYGVDYNPTAVQLARLAIWIHTFVPGLPLSLLDHNLVNGNSLVGIGRLEELEPLMAEGIAETDLFHQHTTPAALLGDATDSLRKLANISDATYQDIEQARTLYKAAEEAIKPACALFNIVTHARIKGEKADIEFSTWETDKAGLWNSKAHKEALKALGDLKVVHFPAVFPSVFLRARSGFDVLLGNPPWEELTFEEQSFWSRHVNGFRGLSQGDRKLVVKKLLSEFPDLQDALEVEKQNVLAMHNAVTRGTYRSLGSGDPDLYKAFSWRFWDLLSPVGGQLGIVVPRTAFSGAGLVDWRIELYGNASRVAICALKNTREWVFEGVTQQYTVVLLSAEKRMGQKAEITLSGPFRSLDAFTRAHLEGTRFSFTEVMKWTENLSLPLLPSTESVAVFRKLRMHPRLDDSSHKQWRARPYCELHATNDKHFFDFTSTPPRSAWPVLKGESFDLWNPDKGTYYGHAKPAPLKAHLQAKRVRASGNANSPFSEFASDRIQNEASLPCNAPRIAFRDIARASDPRTMIAALIPGERFCANKAPTFLFPKGSESDEAFLLGILSSIPLDWYARLHVELSLNFWIVNTLPIPRPARDSVLRARVIELAGRLASSDERFKGWANAVGVKFGPLRQEQKSEMIYELDAVVAHLYKLNADDLAHIFETFNEGWDYSERLAATLTHYKSWEARL